ncbi:MAG: hypothetical protein ACOC33_02015 [bacterium]
MVRGRAYRIAQRDRILKKRKNQKKHTYFETTYDNYSPTCSNIQSRYESRLINNPKVCSCHMCRNPRRNDYLKEKERITIAERKFNEKFKTELLEIENEKV